MLDLRSIDIIHNVTNVVCVIEYNFFSLRKHNVFISHHKSSFTTYENILSEINWKKLKSLGR